VKLGTATDNRTATTDTVTSSSTKVNPFRECMLPSGR
jgi:hypothetical protein